MFYIQKVLKDRQFGKICREQSVQKYGNQKICGEKSIYMYENKKISRQKSVYMYGNSNSQKEKTQNQNIDIDENEPKWMRFFKGNEALKIDLDRSLKCENQELIINYIKGNYTTFSFDQLIMSLVRTQKIHFFVKMLNEIKMRLVASKQEVSPNILLKMMQYTGQTAIQDEFIRIFLISSFQKQINQYNHKDQTEIMRFLLRCNIMQSDMIKNYLEFFKQPVGLIKEYFQNLNLEDFTLYMKVINIVHKIVNKRDFDTYLNPEILDTIFSIYIHKMQDSDDISNQFCVQDNGKYLLETLPSFLTSEQQLQFKKTMNQILYQKYNQETNYGKYMNLRSEKYTFLMTREYFDISDRYLIEPSINLISQFLLNESVKKYDFKLFSIMQRFNLVNKFYIDHGLINFRSLIKSLQNLQKKDRNVLHHQNFMTISKWRVFSNLNYNDIVEYNEDSQYIKEYWNTVKNEYKLFLKDYLQLIVENNETGSFFQGTQELLNTEIYQEEQRILNLSDDDDGDEIGEFLIKDDENDLQDDIVIKVKEQSNQDLRKNTEAQDAQQKYQQYLSSQLDNLNFQKCFVYQEIYQKNSFQSLKWYLTLLESIPEFLYFEEKMFQNIVQSFFEFGIHQEIFNQFPYMPIINENFIVINEYFKQKEIKCFDANLSQRISDLKSQIDQFYKQNSADPLHLIRSLSKQMESINLKINQYQKDQFADNLQYVLGLQCYRSEQEEFNQVLEKLNRDPQNILLPKKESDFKTEQFALTQENFVKKLIYSPITQYILKESQLKRHLQNNMVIHLIQMSNISKASSKILLKIMQLIIQNQNNLKFQKNVVDYPFYVDFVVENKNQKHAIIVLDNDKLILGVNNVMSGYIKQSQNYFQHKGYKVHFFRFQDYDIKGDYDFLKNLS